MHLPKKSKWSKIPLQLAQSNSEGVEYVHDLHYSLCKNEIQGVSTCNFHFPLGPSIIIITNTTHRFVNSDLVPLQLIESMNLASINRTAAVSHACRNTLHAETNVPARNHGNTRRLLHTHDASSRRRIHLLRWIIGEYPRQ